MRDDDVEAAHTVMSTAFDAPRGPTTSVTPPPPPNAARSLDRFRHLLHTDPDGSLVAEVDDAVVGIALSHVRSSAWVLAILAIDPAFQQQGIGKQLLDRSLSYGAGAIERAIFSTRDSRALHRYATAGLALQPAVRIEGVPRVPIVRSDDAVIEGSAADLDLVAHIDEELRGANRRDDLAWMLRSGGQTLLLAGEDGYALVEGGRVGALTAKSPTAARRLFEAVISRCPDGEEVQAGWVSAHQQWAIQTAVHAGLRIVPGGPIMTDNWRVLSHAYLPNGFFG